MLIKIAPNIEIESSHVVMLRYASNPDTAPYPAVACTVLGQYDLTAEVLAELKAALNGTPRTAKQK